MRSGKLMLGVSLAAFAASAAAQTTVVGTNQSTVSQTGSNNSANVSNAVAGNDDNSSSVAQNGNSNSVTVEQIGDLNISRIRQVGDFNQASHRQAGNRNNSDTDQLGNSHSSSIAQRGDDNLGVVVQNNGNRNGSTIGQGSAASGGAAGNSNAARVQQLGSDNRSTVSQQANAGGTTTASAVSVSNNFARVVQGDASRARSQGAVSTINQSSRGNSATVLMFEGSTAAQNQSIVTQQHNGAPATAQPGSGTLSGNRAIVAIRGFGNRSSIDQNGLNNNADVTLLGGGTATGAAADAESGRTQGNISSVVQGGRALSAVIVGGSALASEGQGNRSDVAQSGNSHHAEVWQRGLYESASITQGNGSQSANITYSDGAPARAFASVSQRGERGSLILSQFGDVSAEVTQGLGARSAVSVYQIDAGDFGTTSNASDPINRALNRAGIAQYGDSQVAIVRQFAINASATIFQQSARFDTPSSSNYLLLEQGLSDTVLIAGGEPSNSAFFGSSPSGEGGANSRNLVANVTQGNGNIAVSHNRATVRQDGVNLSVTVAQAGSAAADVPNRIDIAQRGSENRATAIQRAGVGPSGTAAPASGQAGDEFHFPGGRRSAEVTILQKNVGNNASVEQRGLGQLARIEQSGARNSASILQEAGATNATAVIRQSGNDNSYSVAQTQAGQYIVVSQTGNNNAVTNVVQRPDG